MRVDWYVSQQHACTDKGACTGQSWQMPESHEHAARVFHGCCGWVAVLVPPTAEATGGSVLGVSDVMAPFKTAYNGYGRRYGTVRYGVVRYGTLSAPFLCSTHCN